MSIILFGSGKAGEAIGNHHSPPHGRVPVIDIGGHS